MLQLTLMKKYNYSHLVAFIVLLLLWSINAHSQGVKKLAGNSGSSFAGAKKIIFEDALTNGKAGTFPAGWDTIRSWNKSVPAYYYDKKKWRIVKEDAGTSLESATIYLEVMPSGLGSAYLPHSFDIGFDCMITDIGSWGRVRLRPVNDTGNGNVVFTFNSSGAIFVYDSVIDHYAHLINTPVNAKEFDQTKWHHFILSYKGGKTVCYIDGEELLNIPSAIVPPTHFSLGGGLSVRFKNVEVVNTEHSGAVSYPDIYFDYDKADVPANELHIVKELADSLKKYSAVKVSINGYADDKGSDEYNMPLSERRANAVADLLALYGIERYRISIHGHGAVKPGQILSNGAGDRKVEFTFK